MTGRLSDAMFRKVRALSPHHIADRVLKVGFLSPREQDDRLICALERHGEYSVKRACILTREGN